MGDKKKGFFSRLVEGLTKTRDSIVGGIDSVFSGFSAIDDDFYEEIEETLIMGDLGIQTTMAIVEDLRKKVKENHIKDPAECKDLLIASIKEKMDLDIQVSKLKLMKANHTSQKYRLEDNITKHYPQQIAIFKERINGFTADMQKYEQNKPLDKEQFSITIGGKAYTDKKEAGTALVEMCKEIKSVNAPAVIGEYAGFKMAVSFDSFNHKFVMNIKGQLSHNLEIGVDPLGNISRINHALEAMTKELAEASTKLENVERQLETAKVEVTKPFAQEAELSEKLDRLSALNALLNMDEKGDDGIGMEDDKSELGTEQVADTRKPYPIENTRHNYAVENGNPQGMRLTAAMADKPAQRVSLKEKLETMKVKAAGNNIENSVQRDKGKEEYL